MFGGAGGGTAELEDAIAIALVFCPGGQDYDLIKPPSF